jgi:hypothetical protein
VDKIMEGGYMTFLMNNWGILMFLGSLSIFIGLIFAIQEHNYIKTLFKSIISFIGWNVLIPSGILLYIASLLGIIIKIGFLIFK